MTLEGISRVLAQIDLVLVLVLTQPCEIKSDDCRIRNSDSHIVLRILINKYSKSQTKLGK